MSNNTGRSADIMESRTIAGLKGLAIVGSVLVYILIVVYAEYHFFNLISGFVPGGMQVVGMIAVGASGITALLLPVALHFWFRSGIQAIAGYIFYGIHFLMMFANLILDSSLQGTAIADTPDWIETVYAPYILPGYIAFYALAWSILWFTDSNSQRIDKSREVVQIEEDGKLDRKIAIARFKSDAITAAYNSQGAQHSINRLIATTAPQLLASELGISLEELGPTQGFEFWMAPAEQKEKPAAATDTQIIAATGSPSPSLETRRPGWKSVHPIHTEPAPTTQEFRTRYVMYVENGRNLDVFETNDPDRILAAIKASREGAYKVLYELTGNHYQRVEVDQLPPSPSPRSRQQIHPEPLEDYPDTEPAAAPIRPTQAQ